MNFQVDTLPTLDELADGKQRTVLTETQDGIEIKLSVELVPFKGKTKLRLCGRTKPQKGTCIGHFAPTNDGLDQIMSAISTMTFDNTLELL